MHSSLSQAFSGPSGTRSRTTSSSEGGRRSRTTSASEGCGTSGHKANSSSSSAAAEGALAGAPTKSNSSSSLATAEVVVGNEANSSFVAGAVTKENTSGSSATPEGADDAPNEAHTSSSLTTDERAPAKWILSLVVHTTKKWDFAMAEEADRLSIRSCLNEERPWDVFLCCENLWTEKPNFQMAEETDGCCYTQLCGLWEPAGCFPFIVRTCEQQRKLLCGVGIFSLASSMFNGRKRRKAQTNSGGEMDDWSWLWAQVCRHRPAGRPRTPMPQ